MQVEFAAEEFGDCPVCGAAGGNCRGDSDYHGTIRIAPRQRLDPSRSFKVPERIYEDVVVNGRRHKKLVYGRGDLISIAEAKRLGLLPS